jgi:hypothetical protein
MCDLLQGFSRTAARYSLEIASKLFALNPLAIIF